MIAKYKGRYFCIDISAIPYNIWRYDFVEDFDKGVTSKGTVFYEKYVMPDDLDEIFDAGFSVKWHDQWCYAFYSSKKDLVSIINGSREFAEKYQMEEIERGVYGCAIPVEECQAYRLWTCKFKSDEDIYTVLTLEEFKRKWQLLKKDLLPPEL